MNRHTFVVQVYPDGFSALENLGTGERVRISELAAVGPQIEGWLEDLPDAESGGAARPSRTSRSAPTSPSRSAANTP